MGCLCARPHVEEVAGGVEEEESRGGLVVAMVSSTRVRDVDSQRKYLKAVTELEASEGASYADTLHRMDGVGVQSVTMSYNMEFDPYTARYTPDNHISGGLVGVGVVAAVESLTMKGTVQSVGAPETQRDVIRWLRANGWGENSINVMFEEPGLVAPTVENIRSSIRKAVSCCADAVWISYSGYCTKLEGEPCLLGCDGATLSFAELRSLLTFSAGTVVNVLLDLVCLNDSCFPIPPLYSMQYHKPANINTSTTIEPPVNNPEDELFSASARLNSLNSERDQLLASTEDLRSQLQNSAAELSKLETLLRESSPDMGA